jgi:hypothetical protein
MRGGGSKSAVRAVRQIDRTPAHQSKILRRQDIVPERRMARSASATEAADQGAAAAMVRDGATGLRPDDGVLR